MAKKKTKNKPAMPRLETLEATLRACEWDLAEENERTRALDAKLSQLAAFSGLSISVTGAIGSSVLVDDRLALGFAIALSTCLGLGSILLLVAVAKSFAALAPKKYAGTDEGAINARTTLSSLSRSPEKAIPDFIGTRRTVIFKARAINDKKASSTKNVYWFAGSGFAFLVSGLLISGIGSLL